MDVSELVRSYRAHAAANQHMVDRRNRAYLDGREAPWSKKSLATFEGHQQAMGEITRELTARRHFGIAQALTHERTGKSQLAWARMSGRGARAEAANRLREARSALRAAA
jgi:hypothetical protein